MNIPTRHQMKRTEEVHKRHSRAEILEAYELLCDFYQRFGLAANVGEVDKLYQRNKIAFALYEARRLDLGRSTLEDLTKTKQSLFINQ